MDIKAKADFELKEIKYLIKNILLKLVKFKLNKNLNYGHVGSLIHIKKLLKEIDEFLN